MSILWIILVGYCADRVVEGIFIRRHGFHIAGTLPGAFHHPRAGFVDAHVLYKTLVE